MKSRSIEIQDLYKIKYLRELAISLDSKKIAYTVEWMDQKQNKYFSNLYVTDETGNSIHYLRGNKNVKNPRWSPNGEFISFIMTEKEKQNIWVIPANGGEAYAVTDAKGILGDYRWTADSRYIICEFLVKKDDKERIPEKDKPPLYYRIENLPYKYDGEGILPEEKNHVWKVNVKTGQMRQLTFGKNGDYSPTISPDGKKVAFVSNRNKNHIEKYLYIDIFVVDLDGKNERKIKTPPGPKGLPSFSPDGKYITYVGREYPEEQVGWRNVHMWLVPLHGGKAINLTHTFDGPISDDIIDDLGNYAVNYPVFSRDGRFIYFIATTKGSTILYKLEVARKKITRVLGDNERIYAFDYDGKDTFALAISNSTDPGNLYIYKNGKLDKLTDLNKNCFKTRRIPKPEEFRFKGHKGDEIQGWLLKPPNFNTNRKYPLIVEIHGGPHVAYGNSFFHEFQVLAANGYIVFYSNPHGGTGYGEKFAKALHNRWGIPDYVDIMKAVNLLSQRKYIDKNRMGVMGGSYGGFMTNWIIGHTDIFKCAVTMRSVVNMLSFFSEDFGFALPKEFKGNWWEKRNFQFY